MASFRQRALNVSADAREAFASALVKFGQSCLTRAALACGKRVFVSHASITHTHTHTLSLSLFTSSIGAGAYLLLYCGSMSTIITMSATVAEPIRPDAAIEGSCACGKIKYTGSAMPTSMTNCHCRQCQKLAGAPYLTWAAVERTSLTWNTPPKPLKLSAIAERTFCHSCGSSMTMQYYFQPQRLSIAAGTIDRSTTPLPRPREHIFLTDKASWFKLPDDGLDRFEEFDPPFQSKLEDWKKEHLNKS
jgi:hypothetical protein